MGQQDINNKLYNKWKPYTEIVIFENELCLRLYKGRNEVD